MTISSKNLKQKDNSLELQIKKINPIKNTNLNNIKEI